jgi:hypothetical protein
VNVVTKFGFENILRIVFVFLKVREILKLKLNSSPQVQDAAAAADDEG